MLSSNSLDVNSCSHCKLSHSSVLVFGQFSGNMWVLRDSHTCLSLCFVGRPTEVRRAFKFTVYQVKHFHNSLMDH